MGSSEGEMVLGRLAWINEIELYAVIIGPGIERPPTHFRAVIDDQDIGISPLAGNAFQHFHDPLAGQREVDLDGGALARALATALEPVARRLAP